MASYFRALLLVASILFASLSVPVAAQSRLGDTEIHVPATLVAESQNVHAGQTVTLAFVMKPKPTWHGYWQNPGDAGIGQSFDWKLSSGVTAGNPSFPVPQTLLISGIMNYVYEDEYAVLVDLKLPDNLLLGNLPITVKSEWLACTKEICVPEKDELSINLQVVEKDTPLTLNSAFDSYRAALPRALGNNVKFTAKNGIFRLAIPLPADTQISNPYFFIHQDGIIGYAAPQKFTRDGDMLFLETAAQETSEEPLSGVLKIAPHTGLSLEATNGDVTISGTLLTGRSDGSNFTGGDDPANTSLLFIALGGAILGGLLLNLMPCVFPILSLKAVSLAKAGGDQREVRRDALAYTAGVVLVATALGAILLALRASGAAVGWAFQLQDPRIIFVLLALVMAIGFNLAGLFEVRSLSVSGSLAAKSGATGSFWTGALAAFVATPCTGPFMAAAIGATIVLPPIAALIIFAGLGVGLALPFLAIAYIPAIRGLLPKPGPWLETFRHVMAIPMFLTAIALIWLLGKQIHMDALAIVLVFLLLVAIALWWLGGSQSKGIARGWVTTGITAALILGGVQAVANSDTPAGRGADGSVAILPNEQFSETRLAELRSASQPVFAYFTADWCITCKANEAAAIQRQETADAFKASNVAVLVGDWTRPDPVISRFLEKHGRAGVPLYLYYAPGAEPVILPQILAVGTLTKLVSKN